MSAPMNLADMDWNEVKKKYLKDNNLVPEQPARRLSGEPSTAPVPSRPAPIHPSLYAMDDLPPRTPNIPFVPPRVRTNGFTVPGPPPFPPPGPPREPHHHPDDAHPKTPPMPPPHPRTAAPCAPPFPPGHPVEPYPAPRPKFPPMPPGYVPPPMEHPSVPMPPHPLPVTPPEPTPRQSKFTPMPMSTSTQSKQISPPRLIHPTLATTPIQHVPLVHIPDHATSSPMDMDVSTSPGYSPSLEQNLLLHSKPTTPQTPSLSKVSPVPPPSFPKTPCMPLTPSVPNPTGLASMTPTLPATPFTYPYMTTPSIPMPPSLQTSQSSTLSSTPSMSLHTPFSTGSATPFSHTPSMPLSFPPTLPPLPMPPMQFVPSMTPTAMPSTMTPWDGQVNEGTVPHQLINHWTGVGSASSPVPSEQLNWKEVLDKPLPPAPVNGLSYLLLQPPTGVPTDVTAAYWEGGEAYFRKRLEDIDRRLAAARELELLESMTPLQKALYLKLQQSQQQAQQLQQMQQVQQVQQVQQLQQPVETAAPMPVEASAMPPLPPSDPVTASSTVESEEKPVNEVELRRDFKENAKKIVKGIIRQSMFKHGDFKKFEGALREIIRSCLKDELELDKNFNYLISDQVKDRIIQSTEKFAKAHKLRRRS